MRKVALQISPEVKGAYFADVLEVARQELALVLENNGAELLEVGPLRFFVFRADDSQLQNLLRLSFAQGLFHVEEDVLRPMDLAVEFRLHEDFVFGSKYRGKTNERLTQMLINAGLAATGADSANNLKLLDPMCGRATTPLWAMRYGMRGCGIEQDPRALADIHRNLKKWSKLHRQKHKLSEGFVGGGRKTGTKFLDFSAEGTSMRIVNGDARQAATFFSKEKFDLIVSDLPYGVQHGTTHKTRNPLNVIGQCVEPWRRCLKPGGVVVLAFNRYIPRRKALVELFSGNGFEALPFGAEHRMSESIVRDVVVFRNGGAA